MLDPVTDAKRRLYALLLAKSHDKLTAGELDMMMLLSSDPEIQKLLADKEKS